MKRDMIFKELVELDWQVASQNEVFDRIADKLCKLGYVKPSYAQALKVREVNYPTGLAVKPYPVAIPHAEMEHIIKPFIAPIRLKTPVEWHEMGGDDDAVHPIKFIFMLGFLKSGEHIELLQVLVDNFQDESYMDQLEKAQTVDEYYDLVCGMKGMDQ